MTIQDPKNSLEQDHSISKIENKLFQNLQQTMEEEAKEVPTLATRRSFLQKIVSCCHYYNGRWRGCTRLLAL
jgi:hypothetical protein